MAVTIDLFRFRPEQMEDNSTVLALAKRRSGKSVLITDLMWHWHTVKKTPKIMVMSGSEDANAHFSNYVPNSFIYKQFSEQAIMKLIAHQKSLIQKNPAGDHRCLLILDDIGFNRKAMRSEALKEIMTNGRHALITIFLTLQYVTDVTPDIRSQIEYVLTLKEPTRVNQEKLWKYFYGIFPKFDMFRQVLVSCTENYGCVVLDNTSNSASIKDCVFWFKGREREPFKFGSPSIWTYDEHLKNSKQRQMLRNKEEPNAKVDDYIKPQRSDMIVHINRRG